MKKIFTLAAFLFAVAISSSALATNWAEVCTAKGYIVYVDKDSIRHGIYSKQFRESRNDGFSAHVKVVEEKSGRKHFIYLMGFWIDEDFFAKETAKYYAHLDELDENGNPLPSQDTPMRMALRVDADTDGIAPILYDYIEKNLP